MIWISFGCFKFCQQKLFYFFQILVTRFCSTFFPESDCVYRDTNQFGNIFLIQATIHSVFLDLLTKSFRSFWITFWHHFWSFNRQIDFRFCKEITMNPWKFTTVTDPKVDTNKSNPGCILHTLYSLISCLLRGVYLEFPWIIDYYIDTYLSIRTSTPEDGILPFFYDPIPVSPFKNGGGGQDRIIPTITLS